MLTEFSRAIQLACINYSLLLLSFLVYAFQCRKKTSKTNKQTKDFSPCQNFLSFLSHFFTTVFPNWRLGSQSYKPTQHTPNGLKWQLCDCFTPDEKILCSQILNKIASYKVCTF